MFSFLKHQILIYAAFKYQQSQAHVGAVAAYWQDMNPLPHSDVMPGKMIEKIPLSFSFGRACCMP